MSVHAALVLFVVTAVSLTAIAVGVRKLRTAARKIDTLFAEELAPKAVPEARVPIEIS